MKERKGRKRMGNILDVIVLNLPLVLCLLAGVALLLVEVFMPGFGLPGLSGLVLITVGVVMTWNTYGAAAGLAAMLIALALAGISISVSLKSAANGKMSRSALFLKDTVVPAEHDENEAFLGKTGETVTVLNPVGFAEFDGVRLNVLTEGSYLEKGKPVKVTKVEGNKIIVREIKG